MYVSIELIAKLRSLLSVRADFLTQESARHATRQISFAVIRNCYARQLFHCM